MARIGLAVLFAIAAAAFLFLVVFLLSGFANRPTNIDEFYFSACAVRGLDTGAIPIAGCHDNKAPLTFLVYEITFLLGGFYNFAAVKLTACLLAIVNTTVLAWIAFRRSGIAAAAVTASLMLSIFSSEVGNLALKTELVGGLFLTLALLMLSAPLAFRSWPRLALAGLLVGMAVIGKQPYVFAGFAITLWLFLCEPVRSPAQLPGFLARSLWFGVFALVPFLLFWIVFSLQGAAPDFLLSFLLYPAVYGSNGGNPVTNLVRHVLTLLAGFTDQIFLAVTTSAAAAALILREPAADEGPVRYRDPRWLFLLVILFLILVLAGMPVWFRYYIMLVAGPMALLTGTIFGDIWNRLLPSSPRTILVILAGITFGVLASAAATWRTNGKSEDAVVPPQEAAVVRADASSRYAYQLGNQPNFYGQGLFVPASSIQFAWALTGTPDNFSYTKPPPRSLSRRLLDHYRARNLARLYADFAKTPPAYIVFDSDYVRAAASHNEADIPGFQDYLGRNCALISRTKPRPSAWRYLYDCRQGRRPG